MPPSITTTHAVPGNLPATHLISTIEIKFCSRCLRVLNANEKSKSAGSKSSAHHCEDRAAAKRPSVSVPFS